MVDLSRDAMISDAPPAVQRVEEPSDVPSDDLQQTVCVMNVPPEARMRDLPPGIGAVDLTPVVRAADSPPVGRMETVPSTASPESARMSPSSPPTVTLEDSAVSSMPMSPNRV